jgi:hypothetical protein
MVQRWRRGGAMEKLGRSGVAVAPQRQGSARRSGEWRSGGQSGVGVRGCGGERERHLSHFRKNVWISVPGLLAIKLFPWRSIPAVLSASAGMSETRRTLKRGTDVGLAGVGILNASFNAPKTEDGTLLGGTCILAFGVSAVNGLTVYLCILYRG